MKLTYNNKKLEKICTNDKEMRKQRGNIAKPLRRRINALEAFATLQEVVENDPLGKLHPLHENREGQWAGKLSANYRLIIVPQMDGSVEIEEVFQATSARVQDIEDYHER